MFFSLLTTSMTHRSAELNVNKNLIISYLIIMQFVLFSDKATSSDVVVRIMWGYFFSFEIAPLKFRFQVMSLA